MEITRIGSKPTARGQQIGLRAQSWWTSNLRAPALRVLVEPWFRLNPERGPHGILIRWVKRSSSLLAVATSKLRVSQL